MTIQRLAVEAVGTDKLAAPRDFEFLMRVRQEDGSHGVFRKKVHAQNPTRAWNLLMKDLTAMKLLSNLVSIERQWNGD